MNDLTDSITALKAKTEQIINLFTVLKKENEGLKENIKSITQEIENKDVIIKKLEEETKQLSNKNNEEENRLYNDSKEKINELVQEIDNCIALLK